MLELVQELRNQVRLYPPGNVVLAFHCIPQDVEPDVEDFWRELSASLSAHGLRLILASSVSVGSGELAVLGIPFEMTGFVPRPGGAQPPKAQAVEIADVIAWYGCSPEDAAQHISGARQFFGEMLDALCPVAVIGWQSVNPVTRLVRELVRSRDIVFWSAERGWLRKTLMFDLQENNFLTEVNLSFALRQVERELTHEPDDFRRRTLFCRQGSLSRYASAPTRTREQFRAEKGIPEGAHVVALCTHGEPSVGSLARSYLRELHGFSYAALQAVAAGIHEECRRRGFHLLVQEHPFNRGGPFALQSFSSSDVFMAEASVETLMAACDTFLFTTSTIQFDAALARRRFGLLTRSALAVADGAPCLANHESIRSLLDDVLDDSKWPDRWLALERRIDFLLRYTLFRIDTLEQRIDSASRFANDLSLLVTFIEPTLPSMELSQFLTRWGDDAPPQTGGPSEPRRWSSSLQAAINNAFLEKLPCSNFYCADVFPDDLYRDIIANLPPDEYYQDIQHPDAIGDGGKITRKLLDLAPHTIAKFPDPLNAFWAHALEEITSREVTDTLFEKLGIPSRDVVPVPVFYRDYTGYRIGVHPDAPYKVATMQIYLPPDSSMVDLGTCFYLRDGESFVEIKRNLFLPNSLYAFRRTDESWHGVPTLREIKKNRDTLAITYYMPGYQYSSVDGYIPPEKRGKM